MLKKLVKTFSRILLKIVILFLIITIAIVVLYRFVNPPITPLMAIRYFESNDVNKTINKKWRNYDSISQHMALAVIAAEDQKFLEHNGFDLDAIKYAVINNLAGKGMKGASTISQQVAKNAFLWPSRTWFRKVLEAYFTTLIELFWTKKRILEVYLNVAEMGDGIYGAETASRFYFNKSSTKLTRDEAALIAAVLPNPRTMSPSKPSSHVLKRKKWIVQQMNFLGGISSLNFSN